MLVLLAVQLISCRKEEPPVVPPSDPPSPDTNWVTMPQVDLPWPGLANSVWPMFLHDPQHTGRSPHHGPQVGRVEWLFDAGHLIYSSPAIDQDESVYFSSLAGSAFRVSASGGLLWQSLAGRGESSPTIGHDGTVYLFGAASTAGTTALLAFDRDGAVKWEYGIGPSVSLCSPSISKDGQTIYLAARDLYAIATNGTLRWRLEKDSTEDGFRYSPAVSPDGATLYVPGYRTLYAVDTSGIVRWKFAHSPPVSTPAVDNDGNIYIGAGSQYVYSLSSAGGVRWVSIGISWGQLDAGPVIGCDGTTYITGRALHALDYAGKLKWKYALSELSQSIPAIDSAGTIYLGTNTTRAPSDTVNFLALNPNGTLKFQMCLRSPDGTIPDISSRPAIGVQRTIYVGSDYPHGFQLFKIR